MATLKLYALIFLGIVLGLVGLRFHWTRLAEERIEANAARASNERMRRANDVHQEIESLSDDDLRERASRWVRRSTDD